MTRTGAVARSLAACAILGPLPQKAPRDLASVLEPIRAEHRVPALAGAVLRRGEVTAIGAVGVRRQGSDVAVTTSDRWHLGSCTKAMTATLIARLVERGELGWDTTLAELFPERAEAIHPGYRGVTVRQLVDHRAGLPQDRSSGGLLARAIRSADPVREQRLRILDRVLAREPAAPAGTVRVYSNTGFVLAGAVVERVTDQAFEDAMVSELFEPLGMASVGFGPPGEPGSTAEPWGHVIGRGRARPIDPGEPIAAEPAWYGPAGDVHASLRDWAKFILVHVRGQRGVSELLSEASLAALHTPVEGADYACGFVVAERRWASGPVLAHHGASPLWHSTVWASPADDLAVLVACNQGGEIGTRACGAAVEALLQGVVGR